MLNAPTTFWLFTLLATVLVWVIAWRPLWGLLAVFVLAPLTNISIPLGVVTLHLYQAVLLVVVLAAMGYRLLGHPRVAAIRSPLGLSVVLLGGAFFLSYMHSPDLVTGTRWLLYVGVMFAGFLATVVCMKSMKDLRLALTVLLLIMVVVSVLAFTGLARSPGSMLNRLTLYHVGPFGGAFDNPNALGNYLALLVPFFLALYLHGRQSFRTRFVILVATAASSIALFATYSRSSYLGLLASVVFLLFFRRRGRVVILIAVMLLAAVFVGGAGQRLQTVFTMEGLANRLVKTEVAVRMFRNAPWLGRGLGSFEYFAALSEESALYRHTTLENQYLLMLSEGGILLLLAFAYMIYRYVRGGLMVAYRRTTEPLRRSLVIASGASLVSAMAVGLGEGVMFFPKVNWLLGLILAVPMVLLRTMPATVAVPRMLPAGGPQPLLASLAQ